MRVVLLVALLTLACRGPFLLLPGGKLSGEVKPAPQSFAFAKDAGTIQLETHPEEPYSVNVSGVVVNDGLYVNAGDTRTKWVQNIDVSPLVRARVKGDVYELKARRVTEKAEIDAFSVAWLDLGAMRRDPRKLGEVWIYELEPR
jgi:hypothetical protein